MRLISFKVVKFRNVVDSGEIAVDPKVTCLVGKNEAGKSALLEALYLLNPAYEEKFDLEDQYPRWLTVADRRAGDLGQQKPITATFLLESADRVAVSKVLGEGVLGGETVTISRRYSQERIWDFKYNEVAAADNLLRDFPSALQPHLAGVKTLQQLRARLAEIEPGETESDGTEADLQKANSVLDDRGLTEGSVFSRILALLKARLPRFFRFTGYSTLPGRVDFGALSNGDTEGPAKSGLQTARALLELAGTELGRLGDDNYELRKGELEAVQIDLTRQVFEYWKQNPSLEVLIDVDKETVRQPQGSTAVARFLDIRLRDKRTGYSNNFSQRSSGFQWFFSFLAAFSQFEGEDWPIILLDEPALTLHGKAQGDFLRFINERLASVAPVIYTTHSPFMVETDRLARVRIIEDLGPPDGAVSTNEVLAEDSDSLFPLQAALGYDIAQSLFIGPHNLVVEGASDFIYLTVMSNICRDSGRTGLDPRWRILPVGGASNIPTFVSLVGPHLDVTVLADSDAKGMQRVQNMIDRQLLSGERLITANSAIGSKQADIEDLFSEGDYLKLYNKTYQESVRIGNLPEGARIVKRIEAHKGEFIHGEVAETLLREQEGISFSGKTLDQFAALMENINSTMKE